MRNVRALIAYDGSKFFGWQRQAGFRSVQEALEDGLEALLGEHVVVHGAGRTDTGVHARGQVAHFHVDTGLDDDRLREVRTEMRRELNAQIALRDVLLDRLRRFVLFSQPGPLATERGATSPAHSPVRQAYLPQGCRRIEKL